MTVYRFGPFRLQRETLLLEVGGRTLPLGPKVVETLLALVERPGEVLTKPEILSRIWPEGFVDEANLAQNIYVLRKVLRSHWGGGPIETVPRRGYRFTALVQVETPHAPPAGLAALPGPRLRHLRFAAAAAAAMLALAVCGGLYALAGSKAAGQADVALNSSAARLYAIGRYYWNQRTRNGISKSERYFEAVIRADRKDPQGYAGLASAYAIAADYGYAPRRAALARAEFFAKQALARDAACAEAYAALGLVDADSGQTRRAVLEYRKALALNSDDAAAHQWYGTALLLQGQASTAFRELQKAADLDPESVAATDWLAQAAFIERRYKDAVSYGFQALDLSPGRYEAYRTIGMAYEALGEPRAAISAYETYGRMSEGGRYDAAALLAQAYAASGDLVRAREELAIARKGAALGDVSQTNLVAALAALGETDEAFHLLDAGKSRETQALLAIDPRMDALRRYARFKAYVQHPG
jgi:DNA-binding winged helix-turn-helix (wHTH) protein/Flp pilus assembly protein TadD